MPLDVDYIAGKQAIDKLHKLLSDQPHGEREEIADEIIELVDAMEKKWTIKDKEQDGRPT